MLESRSLRPIHLVKLRLLDLIFRLQFPATAIMKILYSSVGNQSSLCVNSIIIK